MVELREQVAKTGGGLSRMVVTPEDSGRLIDEMRAVAREPGRSLLEVSTGMAIHLAARAERLAAGTVVGFLKGVEVGARMAYREVVPDHLAALASIRREGLYRSVHLALAPSGTATRGNFDPRRLTLTGCGLTPGRLRRAAWRR